MAGAKAAHISQRDLLAWFDEQERKPFPMVSLWTQRFKQFDPLYTRRRKDAFPNLDRIIELYERGISGEQGRPGKKTKNSYLEVYPKGCKTSCTLNGEQT